MAINAHPLFRTCLGLAAIAATVLAPNAADAAEIVTKSGARIIAERMFPTYTMLVALTPNSGMQLIPNDDVATIDGVPFNQVYWGESTRIDGVEQTPTEAGETASATAKGPVSSAGFVLRPGTLHRYNLTEARTTWIRRGQAMVRRPEETATGQVRVTVVGAAPDGPIAIRESTIEQPVGQPARQVQRLELVEMRPEGMFLVGHQVESPMLSANAQAEERIGVPPLVWPAQLEVGRTWVSGPFKRMNAYQVTRMEVVGRESVTVPAGTYAEAFKVVGFGHVFGGSQALKDGARLITDHGTVETTVWFVPGVGPVKEETKVHLHQDFFPAGDKGAEIPFVVEERSSRHLAEFTPGADK